MKIVLTVHQFLPEHSSGTEIIALTMAKELQSRGHQVTIVTGYPATCELTDDKRFDYYEYDGLPVVRFHHADVPMGGQENVNEAEYYNWLFLGFFKGWLAQERPDLVHFVHLGRLTASAIEACAETGIPTFFTATDFWIVCPTNQLRLADGSMCTGPKYGGANCIKHIVAATQPRQVRSTIGRAPNWMIGTMVWAANRSMLGNSWLIRFMRALSARSTFLLGQVELLSQVIVPSRIMRDMLAANGIPAEKLVLIPYGIQLQRIVRNIDRGRGENLRVAFIGTIAEHKGLHILTRAIQLLPPSVGIELTIYGRTDEFPEYVADLRRTIAVDDRIQFRGPFVNTSIGDVLSDSDLLVCPSLWYENTPLVIYEAQAAGVPVLASDLGGMSEMVESGVNGLLFEKGNSAELARHLNNLATNRELLRTLALGTRIPLSAREHVDRLEALYASVRTAG